MVGFGAVRGQLFEMWLTNALQDADFNALSLKGVVESAVENLGLGMDEVIGLLIRCTRAGGRFRSDGEVITFS